MSERKCALAARQTREYQSAGACAPVCQGALQWVWWWAHAATHGGWGGLSQTDNGRGGGEARGARSLPSPHCPTTPALVSASAAEAVGRPRSWSPCLALQGRVGIPLSLSLSPAFTRLPPPSPDDDLPQTERRPNRPCCCATLGCLSLGALLSTVPKHAHLFVTHRRDRGRDRGRGRSVLRLVGTEPSSAGLRGRDHGGGCVPV